ncbi:MAG: nicotinate-nucleotide diphosphorylase (carboxylating) [Elusimicrobia bacterium RIFCSPLOWO2_01_FULL_60_11]|nr:MAG: nicotinate-nucleotide diphosphorylase (carboxylating) [Elusimicrobia bacterium RIFCSPLOWO2_01_FULL_60_11]
MTLEKQLQSIIGLAFDEESRDLTSRKLLRPRARIRARVVAGAPGVVCGAEFAAKTFKRMDPSCRIKIVKNDGQKIAKGQTLLIVTGRAARILAAERKAVNFIQHLSGVATLASRYVRAVRGTGAVIFDTRKTIPGIRYLQKYAVVCGGAKNHRMNLSQMAMVKDNHLKAVGDDFSAVIGLKRKLPRGTLLEIEAKTMDEVRLALESDADIIMLDNMSVPRLKRAVRLIRRFPKVQIEVSGGVTLKDVRKIARLGVERISVGAITHSAPALDASLEVEGPARE